MSGLRVNLWRVVRSEWTKLHSVRSTRWTLAVTVLLVVGLSALVCAITSADWGSMSARDHATFQPLQSSLVGAQVALLSVGVLGVLAFTGEYGTGMIRSTLGAVPRRLPVLWAKLLVYLAVVLGLAVPMVAAAFVVGQALLSSHHLQTSLSAPGVLRALIGTVLYLGVDAVFAMMIGLLIRSTAGAVAVFVGVMLVLPALAELLPGSVQNTVVPYLPSSAGTAVMQTVHQAHTLSPWAGLGVFCAWTVALLIAGAVLLVRRDA